MKTVPRSFWALYTLWIFTSTHCVCCFKVYPDNLWAWAAGGLLGTLIGLLACWVEEGPRG